MLIEKCSNEHWDWAYNKYCLISFIFDSISFVEISSKDKGNVYEDSYSGK